MSDGVLEGFCEATALDARHVNAASDRLRLVPDPLSGEPPRVYHGLVHALPHFERDASGAVREVTGPVAFTIRIPDDYLRGTDPGLQFRVVTLEPRFFHCNARQGLCCLGPKFAAGTRLRALVEQVYDIVASRAFATDHALDPEARDFFLRNIARVREIAAAAPPLWRRPLAAGLRVEELRAGGPDAQAGGPGDERRGGPGARAGGLRGEGAR
jgi:hypothetical protein